MPVLNSVIRNLLDCGELRHFNTDVRPLMAFADQANNEKALSDAIPMQSIEYLKLIDLTGRIVTHGKRARMDPQLAPILERLGLSKDDWISVSTQFRQHYRQGHLGVSTIA